MSSKNNEKDRNMGNDILKKKKHKHKTHGKKEESLNKSSKRKHNFKDEVSEEEYIKPHKQNNNLHNNDVHVTNSITVQKKVKTKSGNIPEVKKHSIAPSPIKQINILSSDDDFCNDASKYSGKRSVNKVIDVKSTHSPKNKAKHNIYSSSEDESDPIIKTAPSPPRKKPESSDDYFDGWTKDEVAQLLTRMIAELPKKDTLKYISRVEKLNWEKIAFDGRTPPECKEKWKMIEKKIRGFRILQEILADAKVWLENPWMDFRGGKKKNRHPDMPKKPLTSYMIFYMKKKENIMRENPGMGLTVLSKMIAEKFNKLSPKKKMKYNKLANVMKEKYQEEMQQFLHDHPNENQKIIDASKNKKGQTVGMPGPTKPVPPLKLFLEDKIKQHKDDKDFNQASLIQQCKEKWKSMSSKKKIPWIRWAHEAEIKYLEELKAYQAENPSFALPKVKSVLSQVEKKMLQRMEGKPEKPPCSAYGLFSKLMLKDPELKVKYVTPKERMQEIAKMWKDVPKLEKDGYAEQVKHLLENYKLEYASYLESLPEDKREQELASNGPKRKVKVEENVKLSPKKVKVEEKSPAKENELRTVEELLVKEPKVPNLSAFELFEEEMKAAGYTDKKLKKAWDESTAGTKKKYEIKLESLRQKYIVDYKAFLASLKPAELKTYSTWKVENKSLNEDSQSSVENSAESEVEEEKVSEDEDEEEEEEEMQPKNEVIKQEKSSSEGSDSSSSASSSSGSDSSSSSDEADIVEDSDDNAF